ncbi:MULTISPECIES: sensor histidine kinase [Streptomycetaceae]|uniref:Two-component sensor n=1 Tax=Streptantibioticus cattleyicolor (strain ATCC 35852 / DSM 46488 / JCM 4925 / NBRC 14057 / NRRL 8057) TaxID=1003195 RepID=F8K445_STREN|nr:MULTISPECIES: GAF domain-containing protein [Streptomycetaceae]AEW92584.1 two-component sensor [Streptantibioticus cattleyicolor NRRL 8057 = DSM 46488]MYS57366.1 GAF domain-containing protein [Streptomyces sp. SID5468]CCB72939.1 Two-component sensor [Streptantibioticus cattleyicolor NRRL 8057 = DSM 46488]
MAGDDTLGAERRRPAAPQLRLDVLLDALQQHVERVRGTRDQVQALLDSVLAIGSDLDLETVLRQIVQSAVDLVDARYGALGVLGEEGRIRRFITVGMDEGTIAAIGPYPRGEGILGLLIRDPRPLRLPDLTRHPDSVGFPPGHPPMRGFLGVPVRVRDQVFGNLYLTDKRGTEGFDADDEAVLRTLAAAASVAIDNARLYEDARRRQRWLAAGAELTRSLLSGTEVHQGLGTLTQTVREMAGADLATLAVPVEGTGDLVVEAAAGEQAERVRGLALPAATLAAEVYRTGEPVSSDTVSADPRSRAGGSASRIELGPAFFVPLGSGDDIRGVLHIARVASGQPFGDAVLEMITGFAGQAALALKPAEHRRAAERLMVLDDRDRIARDLHDLAIQRLFASGLSLQAVHGRLADRPEAAERVRRVVDDLDDTIKVIRSTIYSLHEHRHGDGTGPRARLLAEVDAAAGTLGFTPSLRMTGLLDTLVPDALAGHLTAVAREALANAARHSGATTVEVSAAVADGRLTLVVSDDGRGIDPSATRRSGLANLRSRAEDCGGTFRVGPGRSRGTRLEWSVPLPADG